MVDAIAAHQSQARIGGMEQSLLPVGGTASQAVAW
jgi:hypothetical protein